MRKILLLAVVILILSAINFKIYQMEHFIKHGKIFYLKLAPKDPRSLMQGDYMALRYDIENQLRDKKFEDKKEIILTIDKNRVAKIKNQSDTDKLGKDEFIIHLKKNSYWPELKIAHRYYFQEGKFKKYQKAVYGKFKIDGTKVILVNLADANFKDL